ncbi:hypothetical protein [Acidiluteibacter ferrifornacis]|uniref:Uncharacterized protein n=1 Tax=Acidiluteibacter ferrifornacis TaxID=2692424 RepID=A0A6N9NJS3_9FLAO|nr:hypothetical protein [Acidiluteibacter ferrifornacis]NBG66938.1 hypothetical protein [Acidiluteibacter ferrifornacis]
MKTTIKRLSILFLLIVVSYGIFGFLIQDEAPSVSKSLKDSNTSIALADIEKEYDEPGSFKSVVILTANSIDSAESFVGQTIKIEGNPNYDEIQIGIQDQKKLTAKLLNNQTLIRETTQILLSAIPLSTPLNFSVAYIAEKGSQNKSNENTLQIRLYEGGGFFGDIGTLNVDLKYYAPLNANIQITALNDAVHSSFQFSELKVWKDYESFD